MDFSFWIIHNIGRKCVRQIGLMHKHMYTIESWQRKKLDWCSFLGTNYSKATIKIWTFMAIAITCLDLSALGYLQISALLLLELARRNFELVWYKLKHLKNQNYRQLFTTYIIRVLCYHKRLLPVFKWDGKG